MEETVRNLPESWTQQKGECKGFKYSIVQSGRRAKIYEVDTGDTLYYEVVIPFKKKSRPDRYASHVGYDFIEEYPTSKYWGRCGWTHMDLGSAQDRFEHENTREVLTGVFDGREDK